MRKLFIIKNTIVFSKEEADVVHYSSGNRPSEVTQEIPDEYYDISMVKI